MLNKPQLGSGLDLLFRLRLTKNWINKLCTRNIQFSLLIQILSGNEFLIHLGSIKIINSRENRWGIKGFIYGTIELNLDIFRTITNFDWVVRFFTRSGERKNSALAALLAFSEIRVLQWNEIRQFLILRSFAKKII